MSTVNFRGQDYDIKIDADGLSFEEMEEMETALGMAWGLIESKSSGKETSMKVIRALIWISLKREIPELQFDDTKSIKMSDLTNLKDDAPDPLVTAPGSTTPSG